MNSNDPIVTSNACGTKKQLFIFIYLLVGKYACFEMSALRQMVPLRHIVGF